MKDYVQCKYYGDCPFASTNPDWGYPSCDGVDCPSYMPKKEDRGR